MSSLIGLRTRGLLFCIGLMTGSQAVIADEGMWLFNDLPVEYLKEKYGFSPTKDWAQHLMLSSVRFNSGGSASFVSSNGLVLTNHHVASDTLQKLSTPERNLVDNGFLATELAKEVKAPDLELNQLVSIKDVTAQVNEAVTDDLSSDQAFKARRAVMAQIEKASLDETGLRSDVVTLFGGAKYHLYRYKKYTDVRLVWAPETKAAFFGGDADNFEYPRYCLDVTLFRVYENDRPAKINNFLKLSPAPVQEGELIFVSGNPGRTQRIFTVAALKYLRDQRLPDVLNLLRRLEVLLQQYGYEGPEQKRRARDDLFGIENSRKAYTGMLQGLQTPSFIQGKEVQEAELLEKLKQDEELSQFVGAWQEIAEIAERQKELRGMNGSFARRSRLYRIAETLVHMAAEDEKPSDERLREYRDSARESLEQQLYSPAPIYEDLEQVKLADALALFVEQRGGDDPLVKEVLAGKSPRERAAQLIGETQLKSVDVRRSLANEASDGEIRSDDAMIQLAETMEGEFRRLREIRDELEERQRQAYARITEATVAVTGTDVYPDATFTLRLAFGTVQGYEAQGRWYPPWTTMAGAYEHEQTHRSEGDWQLPKSWHRRRADVDGNTPLNFVCTADIIGGNSGSPVVNRNAELVGVIFDGNLQSLTSDFFYSDKVGRAICVSASGVVEALRNIYGAETLVNQMGR